MRKERYSLVRKHGLSTCHDLWPALPRWNTIYSARYRVASRMVHAKVSSFAFVSVVISPAVLHSQHTGKMRRLFAASAPSTPASVAATAAPATAAATALCAGRGTSGGVGATTMPCPLSSRSLSANSSTAPTSCQQRGWKVEPGKRGFSAMAPRPVRGDRSIRAWLSATCIGQQGAAVGIDPLLMTPLLAKPCVRLLRRPRNKSSAFRWSRPRV